MKVCPNCGTQMADESKFCTECGKEISQGTACPHCGASVNDGDVFCQNCGKNLKETPNEPIIYKEEASKSGFKKYLPYILGAFVALSVIGYFSSKDSNNSSNSNDKGVQTTDSITEKVEAKTLDSGADYSEEDIKNSVEAMYEQILYAADTVNYDSKYTSADYQSILNKAYAVAVDEVVLDASHWIQGQDCDKPSVSVVSVKKESENKAIAEIKIKLFQGDDYQSRVRLALLFENGKWVVDDFISFGDGGEEHSEKAYLKKYIEDCQSKPKEDYSWLQGHWVYEQGSYKGHFIIQGDKIKTYSTMNPEPAIYSFKIDGDVLSAKMIDGLCMTVPIVFKNHRLDYGEGKWMHKVDSSNDSYSSRSSSNSSSSRTFYSEQIVIGYLANQSFRCSNGLTMRVDGSGRLYVDGDYAGVLSVLRYNSTSALLRYGGGMYGEGKLTVHIVGDKFTLTDPTDGTVYYQR